MIYHICRQQEWQEALRSGRYAGSSQDIADGFIHFSDASQIKASAAKHRAGQTGLVLLACDEDAMGSGLKWERSRDDRLFPHYYGELPLASVISVEPLPLGADGVHVFPV